MSVRGERTIVVAPGNEKGLVPGRLAATVTALYGDAGESWLESVPVTIAACAERWGLAVLPPFADLSYNYIAPALLGDGSAAILKIGVPGDDLNPELGSEIEALRRFGGRGCARLLASDLVLGALLLERVTPGTTLASVADDEQATRIAARLMERIWRPIEPDHRFPTVARWGLGFSRLRERFGGGTGPLPAALTEKAEQLFADLLASSAEPVLLHGDLHHWNILRATREPWLAVDPKGVVGEPAYEVGALLRNMVDPLLQVDDPVSVVSRRFDILSGQLGFDRGRLIGWSLSQAMLSAWWDIEDGTGSGESAVHIARLIDRAR